MIITNTRFENYHHRRGSVHTENPKNHNAMNQSIYQSGNEWQKFLVDAPVLKKGFRLSFDPTDKNLTDVWQKPTMGGRPAATDEGGVLGLILHSSRR
jgi:hypothetical protein